MKKIKYIFSIVLFFILLSLVGELYVWNLVEFGFSYNSIEVHLSDEINEIDFINDVVRLANETNVEIFLIERTFENIFSETIRIFGTAGVEEQLQSSSQIIYGTHSSIMLGNASLQFHQWEEINSISQVQFYHLIGNESNQYLFRQRLLDIHEDVYFHDNQGLNEISLVFFVAWLIVMTLLLFMTLFDVALLKKEVIIRLVSGERLKDFVLRHVAQDLIFYVLLMTVLFFIIGAFSHLQYLIHITLGMFLLFLLFNSLCYLTVFSVDFRKDISTKKSAKKTLKISYFYKVVVVIFVLVLIAGNSHFIFDFLSYYRQNDFFTSHQNYHYPQIFSEDEDIEMGIQLKLDFHVEFSALGRVISLVDLEPSFYFDFDILYANRGAIPYLESQIIELGSHGLEEKVYFLIPEMYQDNSLVLREIMDIWQFYFQNTFEYDFIYYNDSAELIGISSLGSINSRLLNSPVIILNNLSYEQYSYFNHSIIFFANSSMVNVSQAELTHFLEENANRQAIGYMTNIYDNYRHHWELAQRNMIFGAVLFGALLLINSFVTASVMRYEYDIYAKELILKKILGYRLVDRYKKILLVTFVSGLVGLGSSLILAGMINTSLLTVVLSAVFILLIEMLFILIHIKKVEKSSIQKIIKGGSL